MASPPPTTVVTPPATEPTTSPSWIEDLETSPWIQTALYAVQDAPTLYEAVVTLFQHIQNEIKSGSGTNSPAVVVDDLLAQAEAFAKAIDAAPPAPAAEPPPVEPATEISPSKPLEPETVASAPEPYPTPVEEPPRTTY